MTHTEQIAQLARMLADELGCRPTDFSAVEPVFVPDSRQFLRIISFGSNLVFAGDSELLGWCRDAFAGEAPAHVLDGSNLFRLEEALRAHGHRLTGKARPDHLRRGIAADQPLGQRIHRGEQQDSQQHQQDAAPGCGMGRGGDQGSHGSVVAEPDAGVEAGREFG